MAKLCILICFSFLVGCASAPQPEAFDGTKLVRHGGYDFALKIESNKVLVRVPCCQTYEADEDFRDLLLEAVNTQIGCELAEPVFTDGWIGHWQMTAAFECKDAGAVPVWSI